MGGSGMELSRMNFSFHLQHNLYNIQLEEIEFRAFFLLRLRIPLGFQRDAGKKVARRFRRMTSPSTASENKSPFAFFYSLCSKNKYRSCFIFIISRD